MIPWWMKLIDVAAMFTQAFIAALYFSAIHKPPSTKFFVAFMSIATTILNVWFIVAQTSAWEKTIIGTVYFILCLHFIAKVGWIKSILSFTLQFVLMLGCEVLVFFVLSPWLQSFPEIDTRFGATISVAGRWIIVIFMIPVLALTASLWRKFIEKQSISRLQMFILLPSTQNFVLILTFIFVGIESNYLYSQQAGIVALLIITFVLANISLLYTLRHTLQHDHLQRENELLHDQLQMQEERELQLANSQNQLQQLDEEMIAQLEAIRPFIPQDPNHPAASMMERISDTLEWDIRAGGLQAHETAGLASNEEVLKGD